MAKRALSISMDSLPESAGEASSSAEGLAEGRLGPSTLAGHMEWPRQLLSALAPAELMRLRGWFERSYGTT